MNAPDRIKKLTETFDYNLETYKKGLYNETQVRREFIDPFFELLGWNITNKGKLPQEKDMLKRQIEAIDIKIDQLVYKLYDLTDEEIKIVETAII